MKKRITIIFCFVLLAALLPLTMHMVSADTGDEYKMMTDVSGLHDGDRIILVSDNGSYYQAMATDFSGIQVTVADKAISEQSGMLVLTLSEAESGWYLAANDGYLAADGGALTIVSEQENAAIWSISIASDGTATISCADGSIVFAEHDGAYRFACGEGGNEVSIYNETFEPEHHSFAYDLWWAYKKGKLTIGGNGIMMDFSSASDQPWASFRSEITEIEIQDSVTSICRYAFSDCTQISSISMPCSASISCEAFKNCERVTSVHLTKGTGIMTNYNTTSNSIQYYQNTPWYVSQSKALTVILDDGIESIGDYAFYDCTELKSITIPDSVTSIGYKAFSGCTWLSEITIPESVTSVGSSAFYNTAWWNAQSDGVVYYDYILLGVKGTCGQIIRINEGIRLIANGAFSQKTQITKVTVPDSVTSIGSGAFRGCTGLMSITIPDSVTSIGSGAFYDCTGLTEIIIPDSVMSIGESMFYGCTKLQSVAIGNNVTSIDEKAFSDCSGLISVTIPDSVTNIKGNAFRNCTGLTSVTIGNSTKWIGSRAFYNCTGLMSITIPRCMIGIDEYAFYSCGSLTDVYYRGTKTDRVNNLKISYGNTDLLNTRWHYLMIAADGTVEWNAEDVQYKGTTPYVIANGTAQTPRFVVKNAADGSVVDPANYDFEYRENTKAGTGYVIVTFKGDYEGMCRGSFKIYLPPTTTTTVANVKDGIKLTWSKVDGADGYVIYRRAWSSTTDGWTDFVRWNNTTALEWTDTKVYAGTRYQYGIKAYFNKRVDPVTGATIGGNVGDNFNLGEVGPLKTTVRITTRVLNSVTAGTKQMTVKWAASSQFTGYQIQYATNSAFTQNAKAIKITNPKTVSTVIKSLTSGKTYYVRLRSYHEFNGMTYFGEWSNVKSCKVK